MEQGFDLQHILFIFIIFILVAVAVFLVKKFCKSERSLRIAVYISAALVLATLIWNRVSIAVIGVTDERIPDAVNLLPNAYCPLAGLLLLPALLLWRKDWNHPVFHGLMYIALLGGVLTIFFPATTIGNGDTIIFATRTFSNLMYHSLAMFVAILMLVTGKFRLNWRYWWAVALGMAVHIPIGLFMIQVFGIHDAMFINYPFVEGTIFTWWFVGIVLLGIYMVLAAIYEYVPIYWKKRKEKKLNTTNEKA